MGEDLLYDTGTLFYVYIKPGSGFST